MKYETQIVILGFILGFVAVATNIICLGINERKKVRKLSVWKVEIQWFLLNSFLGLFGVFFGMVSLVYAIGAALQGYWVEKGTSAFLVVIMVLVIWGIYVLHLFISHPSVLMGEYTNRKELLKSIKKETFINLFNNCYVSEHWLVLGEYFIPKTCLIGMNSCYVRGYGAHGGHHHFNLYSIDGKKINMKMAIIHSNKDAKDIIESIEPYAITNHFMTHFECPQTGFQNTNKDLEELFTDYREQHKDLDLLNDITFTDEIIEKWQSSLFRTKQTSLK